jgi:hypothetical protein
MTTRLNFKLWLVIAILLSAMAGTTFGGKIIYVDADATGLNNGSSWANSYKYLQDALADASSSAKPVEIRVAQGIYKPDQGAHQTPGSQEATFQIINGVTIKGGYAGFSEPNQDARILDLYNAILSGDLDGNDEPNFVNNEENSYHVVTGSAINETAILDGFTITGGNTADSGGGMYNNNSSPTVSNCTFSANSAIWGGCGGGMANYYSSPMVSNCTFKANSADVDGGGMHNNWYSSPILNNCTFSANSALEGGGMYNWYSRPKVEDCIFTNNSAIGGGMYNRESSPTIANCTFSANSADMDGGGMYNYWYSSPILTNCTFSANSADMDGGGMYNYYYSSPTVEACTFSENSATRGGGMYNYFYSSPKVESCTFSENSAMYGGGMYNYHYSSSTVTNCILWADVPSEIYLVDSTPVITYSDVQGGWTGKGNININPRFVDSANRNYHLLPESPCINAGDPNFIAEPNETDMDGEARVIFARVDMGADEFNPIRLGIVSKTRVARTEFAYDCNVTFTNLWPFAVTNVELEMTQVPDNMGIIEPNVTFGDIEFGTRLSITSIDTCTFQVDRSQPIEPEKIVWKVKCQRADTGMPLELTINGVSSTGLENITGDLAADEKISLDDLDLARLTEQWLWVGPAGSIPEDITGDGIVNFLDFAKLAENWMKIPN